MANSPMIVEHHPFVKTIARSLRLKCNIQAQQPLLLAVSGGADSVALLRGLQSLAGRRKWQLQLRVGHVQHHLRSEAEGDALFVEQLAGEYGLAYLRTDLDLSTPDLAEAESNIEARARLARYDALEAMAKSSGCEHILTAHHADDQLETLLMRLMRGSSITGLASIAWHRPLKADSSIKLLRPLLAVNRSQILDFLVHIKQPWREDHTNKDVSRLRAKLRCDVLPLLHEINPHTPSRAVKLCDDLRSLKRVLQYATNAATENIVTPGLSPGSTPDTSGGTTIDRAKARDLPKLLLTELLQQQLTARGIDLDKLGKQTLNPIARAIRDTKGGERTFKIANNTTIIITREEVTIDNQQGGSE